MPEYKVSQAAFNDLIDIGAYTQQEWGISQRDNYLSDIEARFETIASNTEHPTVKDRGEIRKGCFSSSINEHIIIFRKTKYGVRILRVLYKKIAEMTLFVLAGLQSIVLIAVCVLYAVVGTNVEKYQLKNRISVYTADADTLGEATHYFSFQCTDKSGFYSLMPIATFNRLGDFSFTIKNNVLLIEHNDYSLKGKQLKKIDISMFSCD